MKSFVLFIVFLFLVLYSYERITTPRAEIKQQPKMDTFYYLTEEGLVKLITNERVTIVNPIDNQSVTY